MSNISIELNYTISYFLQAIIWGAVIIGAAIILKGTPYKDKITHLLLGGVITHLILIWGPFGAMIRKMKKEEGEGVEIGITL